ncbi:MAG TPA: Spo0E family sporulation regulatory protein-aspartic acid phosphatase [Bacillota bacterium]|nr:Spo0E family sporulation regulatory protein-aspartic acid phosphatase [Bacillota bacterium]
MADLNRQLITVIMNEQEQLRNLVGNHRERLTNKDVYIKSLELDQLIIEYMRDNLNH